MLFLDIIIYIYNNVFFKQRFNSNKNGIFAVIFLIKIQLPKEILVGSWSDLYIQDNVLIYFYLQIIGGKLGIGLITPTEKLDEVEMLELEDISLNDGLFNNITISNLNNVNSTIISYLGMFLLIFKHK